MHGLGDSVQKYMNISLYIRAVFIYSQNTFFFICRCDVFNLSLLSALFNSEVSLTDPCWGFYTVKEGCLTDVCVL